MHIIINAVNLDCDGKFRNEIGSYRRVRENTDRISAENDLSVVKNPALSKGTKNRYRKPTKRDGLTGLIDKILETGQPKDFEDLLKQLAKHGCKIKWRGKTISVNPPGAERFFRFRTGRNGLPDGYDEASLRKKIAEMQAGLNDDARDSTGLRAENTTADAPAVERPTEPAQKFSHDKKINLLIDIENSIKAQNSPGYEKWARGFNLQQAAETLLFLQTNNLTKIESLNEAIDQAHADYDALQIRIDSADTRIKDVNALQRHIGAYNKNRDVYSAYLRSKRSPKFRQENEKAIATAEEAKAFFDSLGLDKLPTIKELREEYSVLSQEKQNCYQAKNEMRHYVYDLQSAKKNAEMLLGIDGEQDSVRDKNIRRSSER